jgi:hypothetical protein
MVRRCASARVSSPSRLASAPRKDCAICKAVNATPPTAGGGRTVGRPPYPAAPITEVCGAVPASIGSPPAGLAGEARLGTVGEGSPAGVVTGDGSPAGKREVNPAGLGNGEGRPDAIGAPGAATPGVSAAGGAGCGTARTERLGVCAGLASAIPASSAQAQPRRRARREFKKAFTASSWKSRRPGYSSPKSSKPSSRARRLGQDGKRAKACRTRRTRGIGGARKSCRNGNAASAAQAFSLWAPSWRRWLGLPVRSGSCRCAVRAQRSRWTVSRKGWTASGRAPVTRSRQVPGR